MVASPAVMSGVGLPRSVLDAAADGLVAASAAFAASSGVVAGVAAGGGAMVSVFCSHAASNAAPARMQIYLFIDRG